MYLLDGPFFFLIAIVITALTAALAVLKIIGTVVLTWWIIGPLLGIVVIFWGFIAFVIWAMAR